MVYVMNLLAMLYHVSLTSYSLCILMLRGKTNPFSYFFIFKYFEGRELNNSNHSGTDWTPLMDRCFIDLMLEHVQKGSMVDDKFNKQAWSDMTARFNVEFGSYHDKDLLKSRFKHWRKQFNGMRALFEQNGFAWDERRQMVTAPDELWDSYIKVPFNNLNL